MSPVEPPRRSDRNRCSVVSHRRLPGGERGWSLVITDGPEAGIYKVKLIPGNNNDNIGWCSLVWLPRVPVFVGPTSQFRVEVPLVL